MSKKRKSFILVMCTILSFFAYVWYLDHVNIGVLINEPNGVVYAAVSITGALVIAGVALVVQAKIWE